MPKITNRPCPWNGAVAKGVVAKEITAAATRRDLNTTFTVIPPMDDPRWARWCAPLLDYLCVPRSWKELGQWEKKQHLRKYLLCQMLAWLDGSGKTVYEKDKWKRIGG